MASGILVNMKEEVTCPICLELLTEPLSLDCGHSFCQACITANNKESMISQGEESSCPVCRISYQPGSLRPNRHLSNIVEMLQNVKLSPEEEEKTDLCVRHGEKLLLFCKEDGKFICWLCERSQEHRGHHTFLMEEVAQEYQEKLQAALDRLKAEQPKAEKLGADIREEITSWENQIKKETQSVQDCFQQLRAILYNKEQKELQKLEKEKREILHVLEQSKNELVQQSQLLRDLISDLEHRLQGSSREMLQDVNGIMESSQTFTLKEPKTISKKQRRVFRVPDLNGMLQMFDELTEVRRYWAHITLDPPKDRQNRNFAISADRRQMKYEYVYNSEVQEEYFNRCHGYYFDSQVPQKSFNRCQENNYGVLGAPAISSGKHYWEVKVSENDAWILGVCCQKFPNLSLFHGLNNVHVDKKVDLIPNSRYYNQCKTGYWVIGLVNEFQYNVLSESSSPNPFKLTLCLTVPPRRVGVFVDCTACTVSFYNITNHGFLIYKFSKCSFSEKIEPYFNPMTSSAPMRLCSPSS